MKPGKVVTYRDPHGVEVGAVVVAVVGAGASGCKVLDITLGAETIEGVSHISDAAADEGGWTLDAPPAEAIAEPVTAPIAATVADEAADEHDSHESHDDHE